MTETVNFTRMLNFQVRISLLIFLTNGWSLTSAFRTKFVVSDHAVNKWTQNPFQTSMNYPQGNWNIIPENKIKTDSVYINIIIGLTSFL